MGVHDPFEALSRILEQYDDRGWPVDGVEATTGEEGCLGVTIDVPVPHSPDEGDSDTFVPASATVSEGGGVVVEWVPSRRPLPGTTDPAVSAVERSARLTADGRVRLTVELRIDPTDEERGRPVEDDHEVSAGDDPAPAEAGIGADDEAGTGDRSDESARPTSVDPALAAVRDEAVPPYEDTEYLRRLYESCDTFEEMSRVIEMDVSAETVRRYMIEADLHEPESYDSTESDEAAREALPEEQLITDGFGLPDEVGREDLVGAVVDAKTVYEVGQALGVDQARSRHLLRELDLLDLVRRRIGDDPDRSPSREQVAARIRRAATDAAPEGSAG